jgi:zinc protease
MKNCGVLVATIAAGLSGFLSAALLSPALGQGRPVVVQQIAERVFYVPDTEAKSNRFELIINAGFADEAETKCTGVAHYLEHLILVGRNGDNVNAGVRFFSDGNANGTTSFTRTTYIHQVPVRPAGPIEDFTKLFSFYANRLQGFDITQADAERERNVVRQEYDVRIGTSAEQRFSVEVNRQLLPNHPAGLCDMGTPETIAAYTIEEAKAFHARWYSKNNATFVITGNFDPEGLRELIEKFVTPLPDRPAAPRPWVKAPSLEPVSLEMRKQDKEVKNPDVSVSRIFALPENDVIGLLPAQRLVSAFLSSKLMGSPHSVLVEDLAVTDRVNAFVYRIVPGLYGFSLSATPAPGTDVEALGAALRAYAGGLNERGIQPRDIERLKKRFVEGFALDSMQAEQVSRRLVGWLGSPLPYAELDKLPEKVMRTPDADIARLLGGMVGPARQVTAILEPMGGAKP